MTKHNNEGPPKTFGEASDERIDAELESRSDDIMNNAYVAVPINEYDAMKDAYETLQRLQMGEKVIVDAEEYKELTDAAEMLKVWQEFDEKE